MITISDIHDPHWSAIRPATLVAPMLFAIFLVEGGVKEVSRSGPTAFFIFVVPDGNAGKLAGDIEILSFRWEERMGILAIIDSSQLVMKQSQMPIVQSHREAEAVLRPSDKYVSVS